MADRIRVPTPTIILPPKSKEVRQQELREYYEEWPRLRCSNKPCFTANYGGRPFIGVRSESGTKCPQCNEGILTSIPPETFDAELEEEGI